MQTELELTIEKPFTDPQERYTVTNSKELNCFKLHNLESGKTYIVNPFIGICDCPDFSAPYGSVNNGNKKTCKHIDFLQNNDKIKPLLEKYESINVKNNVKPKIVEPEIVEQISYSLMERKDEDQILEELKGNVIKEYVYDFHQNGKRITGLSYAGVIHIALRMGHIHTDEPIIQEMNGGFIAKVKATDVKRNLSVWGVSFQPRLIKFKSGEEFDDQFVITKVVAKANRNALRKLFDEKIVIEMINQYRKQKGSND